MGKCVQKVRQFKGFKMPYAGEYIIHKYNDTENVFQMRTFCCKKYCFNN